MSLRLTPVLAGRAKGYQNRVMVYAHRRQKARYLAPKNAHVRTPLANKGPEEYHKTWDPRTGVEWHNRMRRRGHFRHWPWATWADDPVRHHEDCVSRRTLSLRDGGASEGMPEWDYYAAVGQDYQTPSHFPLTYVAPFIHQYSGKIWSKHQIEAYLNDVTRHTQLKTIADVVEHLPVLEAFAVEHVGEIPHGLLVHLRLVAEDVVLQNKKKAFRRQQHASGVLRTREMVRYYALPHLRGPAMPETLAQPSGAYPWGTYTTMVDHGDIHPLQQPDARYTKNMYPA